MAMVHGRVVYNVTYPGKMSLFLDEYDGSHENPFYCGKSCDPEGYQVLLMKRGRVPMEGWFVFMGG